MTRVSPIISAAADEPVRCGFRIAFSRARIPGAPARRSPGMPRTAASGLISCDGEQRDPEEDEHGADAHEERGPAPFRSLPTSRRRAPGSRGRPALPSRRRGTWRIGPAAASRLRARLRSAAPASRGGRAGGWRASSPAIPTTRQTTTVRGLKSSPLFGSVNPNCVEDPEQEFREREAEEQADDRGEEAHDEATRGVPSAESAAATRRACAASRTPASAG